MVLVEVPGQIPNVDVTDVVPDLEAKVLELILQELRALLPAAVVGPVSAGEKDARRRWVLGAVFDPRVPHQSPAKLLLHQLLHVRGMARDMAHVCCLVRRGWALAQKIYTHRVEQQLGVLAVVGSPLRRDHCGDLVARVPRALQHRGHAGDDVGEGVCKVQALVKGYVQDQVFRGLGRRNLLRLQLPLRIFAEAQPGRYVGIPPPHALQRRACCGGDEDHAVCWLVLAVHGVDLPELVEVRGDHTVKVGLHPPSGTLESNDGIILLEGLGDGCVQLVQVAGLLYVNRLHERLTKARRLEVAHDAIVDVGELAGHAQSALVKQLPPTKLNLLV
mmetsp:Transcript_43676/g.120911  ORF Transcript_43676/g.120911 Transcript_43676/m.120911 type:complete len:332 (-) Transcript_43676:177-1172(-)